MEGGTGPDSYARNSEYQASLFSRAKESISKAIIASDRSLFERDLFCITDMGCASGPNTVNAVNFVIDVISQKLMNDGNKIPEFQVFFSDLKATDFNTLFKFLPEVQGQPYFYAAAPGSFYDRLLPDCSVHFGMCNLALNFLSKVPPVIRTELADKEANEIYRAQAHEDLKLFLSHRMQEIVPGGLLTFLIGKGSSPFSKSMESAWKEMIDEGLVSKQTLDSFVNNVPIWTLRNKEDIELAVEEVKGFKILHLEDISCIPPVTLQLKAGKMTPGACAAYFTGVVRATTRQLFVKHLGSEALAEELYKRLEARITPVEEVHMIMTILRRE